MSQRMSLLTNAITPFSRFTQCSALYNELAWKGTGHCAGLQCWDEGREVPDTPTHLPMATWSLGSREVVLRSISSRRSCRKNKNPIWNKHRRCAPSSHGQEVSQGQACRKSSAPQGSPHTPGGREGQGELKHFPNRSWAALLARGTAQQNPFYSSSRNAQAAFPISLHGLRAGVCPPCFLQPKNVVISPSGSLTGAACLSPLTANRVCCALGIGQNINTRNKPSKSEGNKLLYGCLHFTNQWSYCLSSETLQTDPLRTRIQAIPKSQGRKDAGCFSSTLCFPLLRGIPHITRKKSDSNIIKSLPLLFFFSYLLIFGDYYCSNYI